MIWAVRQILVPCNYLRIKHGDDLLHSKAVYDFVLPVIFTAATIGICKFLSLPLSLAGHKAVFASLSSLLALLIAFYMAALAAVSTFSRRGMDKGMRGDSATLVVRNRTTGQKEKKNLSYRQVISYLFGYLAFLSIILFLALMALNSIWPRLKKIAPQHYILDVAVPVAEPVLFVLITFGMWQLLIATLLGIYFLSDRIQSLNDPQY